MAVTASVAQAKDQLGWCFDRNGLASDFTETKGTKNWPTSFEFKLQTQDTCWLEAKQSSYVTWRSNEQVTVVRQKYGFNPEDNSLCKKKEGTSEEYYAKNTIEYTSRSPWPYN